MVRAAIYAESPFMHLLFYGIKTIYFAILFYICTTLMLYLYIMDKFRGSLSVIDNENVKIVTMSNGTYTAFVGVADNKAMNMVVSMDRMSQLLIRAVNNRTRERNYFRLYNQLLENEITDEEFDKEIDEKEDDYVVLNNEEADMNDIEVALSLCPYLKDVKDVDDMADLFSFSGNSIRKSLVEK